MLGNLRYLNNFNGHVTEFQYDQMNRLRFKIPDPVAYPNADPIEYTYTADGQRQSMIDASGTTTYVYDARNRLEQKITPQGTLTYTYDDAGNLTSTTSSNANGTEVTYEYDALNRLDAVVDTHQGTTDYAYTPVGSLQRVTYPNLVSQIYGYDDQNRVKLVTARDGNANPLANYYYLLDAAGHRTGVHEQGGRRVAYEYDELHRLTGETVTGDPDGANGSSSWTYDAVSNRQVQSSTLPGVAAQNYSHDVNDRLDAHNYDEQGQTLQDETGATYTWNFQNRLESKTGGSQGGDVSLVYNGDGQLVERTVDGVTTQFLVDDLNPTGYSQIVEEIVNGTVTVIYTYGHDLISQDRLSHLGPSWHVSFYGYDGHGSVRFLTDETGRLTDTYTYDAWGQHLTTTGTTPNPYLYAGERWLESLGLSYNRARMLSTTHGRFWSMDEWEGDTQQPVTLNKYLYGNGGPVMGVDPSGHITLTQIGITVGIVSTLYTAYQFAIQPSLENALWLLLDIATLPVAFPKIIKAFNISKQAVQGAITGMRATRIASEVATLRWLDGLGDARFIGEHAFKKIVGHYGKMVDYYVEAGGKQFFVEAKNTLRSSALTDLPDKVSELKAAMGSFYSQAGEVFMLDEVVVTYLEINKKQMGEYAVNAAGRMLQNGAPLFIDGLPVFAKQVK